MRIERLSAYMKEGCCMSPFQIGGDWGRSCDESHVTLSAGSGSAYSLGFINLRLSAQVTASISS